MVKWALALLLIPSFLQANQQTSQMHRDTMWAQYFFNDTGTMAVDASTHGWNAGDEGTGNAIVTGKHDRAISMNGSGGKMLPDLHLSNVAENTFMDWTVVVSYKLTGKLHANGTSNFFSFDGGAFAWDLGIVTQGALRNRFTCAGHIDGNDDLRGTVGTSSGTYHWAAFRRSSALGFRDMWRDGVKDSSTPTDPACVYSAAGFAELGSTGSGGNLNLAGDMDELTIWKIALTDGEIKQLYTQWIGRRKQFLQ